MKHLFTLFFLAVGFTSALASAEITLYLQQKMLAALSTSKPVPAVIMLKEQVDIQALDEQLYREKAFPEKRAYMVITSLQEMANKTQTPLLNYLSAQSTSEVVQYEGFWIVNMIVVKAIPAVLFSISQREDVGLMDYDYETTPIKALNERPAPEMSPLLGYFYPCQCHWSTLKNSFVVFVIFSAERIPVMSAMPSAPASLTWCTFSSCIPPIP